MKKELREALPLSLKLWLKRMAIGAVRLPLRLSARTVKISRRVMLSATTHGLDVHQAWDLGATPHAPYTQQYGATDFLFLMNALTGQQETLPDPDRAIRTSIILLCYNKIDLTFQCLRSLLREVDLTDTEIIVVNNASVDQTKEVLAYFAGYIRILNNDDNIGFVHGNNKGAALARGKYLVFLNNDTVVMPEWLDRMLETIEDDPQVGVVGPMFIYPDGRIQEAGGIVWKDGGAVHYGWGKSPEDKRFNFKREVDFVTGASLLIRKELFDRLGGFDQLYAPIYYEDTDICFGVRALGYKVIYQPRARILHFEGATVGVDTSQGSKRFQVINRHKFVEKWRETLDREHLSRSSAHISEASNRNRDRIRIIVFDERVPSPNRDAGSLRMFLILKILASSYHVVFVPFNRPQSLDYERALWNEGIETGDAIDYRRMLKHERVRATIVSRPSVGSALIPRIRRINHKAGIIFDMVDTHFLRCQREFEITGDTAALAESKRYRKLETKIAADSDVVWCASSEDKQVMERQAAGKRIEVVPTIHELRDRGEPFESREGLLFIGNQAHRPNDDAVSFYMREIDPLVRKILPDVTLDIIGDNHSPKTLAFDSSHVRIRGYVPDVAPYLRHARVFIAPLRFGAGSKGKVGEAMAYGLPVVTTSIGAEGFGLTHGFDVMIADDPESFAAAIGRLYSDEDLWVRIARNGRSRIEQNFTPEVIAETIYRSINEVVQL